MKLYLIDKKGKAQEVDTEDITCIERLGRETLFRTGPDHFCPPQTLKELLEVFQSEGFYQVDRNQLVNLNKVDRLEGRKLFIGHHAYVVSKRNMVGLKDEIQKYL